MAGDEFGEVEDEGGLVEADGRVGELGRGEEGFEFGEGPELTPCPLSLKEREGVLF